jgi:hypothetical protein
LLLAAGVRWTTKIVLFPVRFLFTAETGREGTNDAAATHYLARPDAPGAAAVSDPDHAVALLRRTATDIGRRPSWPRRFAIGRPGSSTDVQVPGARCGHF